MYQKWNEESRVDVLAELTFLQEIRQGTNQGGGLKLRLAGLRSDEFFEAVQGAGPIGFHERRGLCVRQLAVLHDYL